MGKYRVILFVSRNKDNRDVENFKERRKNFLWNQDEYPIDAFQDFVSKGVVGETSRMYVSVNARDMEKTKKMLLVKLITESVDLTKIESITASLAAKPANRAESKWLLDFDSPLPDQQEAFLKDLTETVEKEMKAGRMPKNASISKHKTINGMAYVVSHKFDYRELLDKWKDLVTLKLDDMLYVTADTKQESLCMKPYPGLYL